MTYPPVLRVDPIPSRRWSRRIPPTRYPYPVAEIRGKMPLTGVRLRCTTWPVRSRPSWGPRSSLTSIHLMSRQEVSRSCTVTIPVSKFFYGKAKGSLIVETADGLIVTIPLNVRTGGKYYPMPKPGGPYQGKVGQPIAFNAVNAPITRTAKSRFYIWDWNATGKPQSQEYYTGPTCEHTWAAPILRECPALCHGQRQPGQLPGRMGRGFSVVHTVGLLCVSSVGPSDTAPRCFSREGKGFFTMRVYCWLSPVQRGPGVLLLV